MIDGKWNHRKTIRFLGEGRGRVEPSARINRALTHAQPVNLAHDKSKHRPINALTHSCHEQKRLYQPKRDSKPRLASGHHRCNTVAIPLHRARGFVIYRNATRNSSNLPPFFSISSFSLRWLRIYVDIALHVLRSSTWRTRRPTARIDSL